MIIELVSCNCIKYVLQFINKIHSDPQIHVKCRVGSLCIQRSVQVVALAGVATVSSRAVAVFRLAYG